MHLPFALRNSLSHFSKIRPRKSTGVPSDFRAGSPESPVQVFGIERLQELAKQLAVGDRLTEMPGARHLLLPRVRKSEQVLYEAHQGFVSETNAQHPIPPGAEWLLDNFHIVQEQLREIRQDLSRQFYAELPELATGKYTGYPRVYGLAMELVGHTDNRQDVEILSSFISSYETISPLSTGELWAFPIMLRVGLIENLQTLMSESLVGLRARRRADVWADRFLLLRNRPAAEFLITLAELTQSPKPEPEFVLQFMQRLRDQDPLVAPALRWLESVMAQADTDIDAYLRELNHRRAIDRVSVGNVITTMRLLSSLDWRPFVENLSGTEHILHQDPGGTYGRMDFQTRDRYRHIVEKLSRGSRIQETDVAQKAVELASRESVRGRREGHVGYYLIDRGISELQARIGFKPTFVDRASALLRAHAGPLYLGLICSLTGLIAIGAMLYVWRFDPYLWQFALAGILMLLPASVFASDIVNGAVTFFCPPFTPPKMDYQEGIPREYQTLVVVPAILSSLSGIEYLLEHLERRYLANRDDSLFFALLSDFGDAPSPHMAEDEELLEAAKRGIETLNDKYQERDMKPFYLFNRERRWNPVAKIWMGWERKRGNLTELNRLLRGENDLSIRLVEGKAERLSEIRYVITLDADTELPLNAARRLVGTITHPLNRAVLDPSTGRVVDGYGIIQPRVDVTAEAAAQTLFSRIYSDRAGLDPYSSVVSDVYQDLFRTGVYIGKAIYDVDAMRATLEGRFPENVLLSHDLLEGTFARVGLASDIVLLEDSPSGYDAYSQRRRRWTRGDWQIADWLFNRAPNSRGQKIPNPLPGIERWKILDNLRRSLLEPAIVLLLAAGWIILPGSPLLWTAIGVAALTFTILRGVLSSLQDHPHGEPWRDYMLAIGQGLLISLKQGLLVLTFCLFQAIENAEAILQAVYRRRANHGLLLEWVSAAEVERGQAKTLGDYVARMWQASALALFLSLLVAELAPGSIGIAAPILLLWFVSPWIAFRISEPIADHPVDLPEGAKQELVELARRMWQFYDDFSVADDHWLPPDNYQIEPKPVVAHRTSPTNVGFLLLAILAAFDFRFITKDDLLVRIKRVLDTLKNMERYQGHWFNWYDTLTLQPLHPAYVSTVDSGNLAAGLIVVKQACLELAEADDESGEHLRDVAKSADELARAIDFRFLYVDEREIFVTGYNVATNQKDTSYYDLLASEARLTSLIAISMEQVPDRHWFHLGRPLTRKGGHIALLSWGGTMFEYLMPTLFVRDQPFTLLRETYSAVVERQISIAAERRLPWGISESGYNAFDFQFNYQYRMFGVPDLSLKREFGEDMVVAPYATFLALPFAPRRAWQNIRAMERAGGFDGYGPFEALDYTPSRRPRGETVAIVRSFMAHHQGMSLVALDNFLNDRPIRRRFEREPAIAAIDLLLQERIPQHTPLAKSPPEQRPERRPVVATAPESRTYSTPHTQVARAHILSNGEYSVIVTNAGGGYSKCRELDVTRWREDDTCDPWGMFVYIKDLIEGHVWSNAYQPTRREPDEYRVTFSLDGAEFWRYDRDIETKTQIAVSPEENVQVHKLTLTNHGSSSRLLELTSYAEVVLEAHREDLAHPAFAKLFIESEHYADHNALFFKRRPRRSDLPAVWAFHLMVGEEIPKQETQYETDRAQFIGRGRSLASPLALEGRLSNSTGAVLDPVMSLRGRIRLKPGESKVIEFVSGVTASREEAIKLVDEYADARGVERALDQARVHARVVLQHLNISPPLGQLFQRLASRILYIDPAFRASTDVLASNVKGQSALWSLGISGDHPIVLVRVDSIEELGLVREMLLAHEYWRLHNLTVDLVFLDGSPTSYGEGLGVSLQGVINTSLSHPWLDKPGGVFVRRSEHMTREEQIVLSTAARVILDGDVGGLEDQLKLMAPLKNQYLKNKPVRRWNRLALPSRSNPITSPRPSPRVERKLFDNGFGGFREDGSEYVITLSEGQWTPAPWTNIISNESFGGLLTEAGLGCTWSVNSQQNRLTPWSNDPICDTPGQAIFLRDESTGEVWTPTLLPIREREPYDIRHGAGYTLFEHTSHSITQKLLVFVPKSDPVQIMRLVLKNGANRARRITATFYAEWVLGVTQEQDHRFVVTRFDPKIQAVIAHNSFNSDFNKRAAFAASSRELTGFTADRTEFLGRNGSLARPAALYNRANLSGTTGGAIDPCVALETSISLGPGEEKEVIFLLGQGEDEADAGRLATQYRDPSNVQGAFDDSRKFWDGLLGAIQVETPDAHLDLMVNRWLVYQVLACRLWGRTALYQSSGAWGFRDQLQDVMALVYAAPEMAREHILRAAGRQFVEGDVQHWWHAPGGNGVRTRISDDPLWLPFVVDHYVTSSGDRPILDVQVPFLQAPPMDQNQNEAYGHPQLAAEKGTLYDHCLRALDHCMKLGQHGLPLMGTGDWNDGMNTVGDHGQGESVWLGWFLYDNLVRFARVCDEREDQAPAENYRSFAKALARSLEEHGWDGAWYRRAYFDDGTPLGSEQNAECKIDAIAQAWSIISDAASPDHRRAALEAVDRHLVRESDQMVLLLTPPFDHSVPSPGYIQGYTPGIRENGGQYTHGAIWVAFAHVLEGDGDGAYRLLRMLNPISHADSSERIQRYKVEPYVLAGDVYSNSSHVGRGGWTWYTGSAGWMYRVVLEGLLGFKRQGNRFSVNPCIPRAWPGYRITLLEGDTRYEVQVENPDGVSRGVHAVELDGTVQDSSEIEIQKDGLSHHVRVVMG